jgi:DNA polymerase-3 subunit epsilon
MLATNRRSAIQTALSYYQARPVYLDTETTGLDGAAEVIEICVLDTDGSPLVHTLVKPRFPVPPDATRIHGITNAMVALAPAWPEVWPEIEIALRGRQVGIYNADFDLRLMRASHSKHRMPWQAGLFRSFCIMKLYAQFYGQWNGRYGSYRWQSLAEAGRQCGLTLPNAHRAQADTLLARALLEYMARAG